jgi:hypothetical protein
VWNKISDLWKGVKRAAIVEEVRAGLEDFRARASPSETVTTATESGRGEAIPEQVTVCPHPAELQREIGGCGLRCNQCGEVLNPHRGPIGVSRRDYESGVYRIRAKMNPQGFMEARAKFGRLVAAAPYVDP